MLYSRRRFLCGATAVTLSMPTLMRGIAAEASGNLIMVTIFLNGGNDGLNTVIPISTKQYGAYTSLRQIPGGGFLGHCFVYAAQRALREIGQVH